MAKIGRKPDQTGLTVLDPVIKQRPTPVPGMTPWGRRIWKEVVESHAPDHFKPGTLEQLRAYCEACSSHRAAILELKKTGAVITQPNGVTKRNPWTMERDACAAIMASLSTKLQLNVNSTVKKGEAPKPESKRAGLLFKGDK